MSTDPPNHKMAFHTAMLPATIHMRQKFWFSTSTMPWRIATGLIGIRDTISCWLSRRRLQASPKFSFCLNLAMLINAPKFFRFTDSPSLLVFLLFFLGGSAAGSSSNRKIKSLDVVTSPSDVFLWCAIFSFTWARDAIPGLWLFLLPWWGSRKFWDWKENKRKIHNIESVDSYFTNILQLLDDRPQLRSSIETLQGP